MATPCHLLTIRRQRRQGRASNTDYRPREYLTPAEAEALIAAAGTIGRHPRRDGTLLLLMYRRALRVTEAITLTWDQVDLEEGWLHLPRLKGGITTAQPLSEAEQTALQTLRSRYPSPTPVSFGARRAALTGCRESHYQPSRRAGRPRAQSASAHAQARLWLCAGEPRGRSEKDTDADGSRPNRKHDSIHDARSESVERHLGVANRSVRHCD